MTNEPPAPEPSPAAESTASESTSATTTTSPLGNMSGETMVMIAGIAVLGVYVIFGLIATEWYPSFESVIAGSFAVVLPRVKAGPVGSGISTGTLMKIVGYVLAVAGLWEFIEGIRFGWDGTLDVIAWMLLAGATALAFLGARAIKT